MDKIPLLVIVGPTASGKTALAVECALEFGGEVVSADSMQIYKGMSIATAKPTADEMKGVKHRLIDFVDVTDNYSVADYVKDANEAIDAIVGEGKLPILCGGTGLYVDSLVNNIRFSQEETDSELRGSLEEKMEKIGAEAMLEELAQFDPETAERLHANNKKRIIRAFEVYMSTGKTFSEMQVLSREEPSRFNPVFIGIGFEDRQKLYDRIDRRVDIMLENGLVGEAREYYDLPEKTTSSQAIGYKELKPYFEGEITLEQAVDNLKLATRHYAKRQLTWFRRNKNIRWFNFDTYTDFRLFSDDVKEYVRRKLYE